MAEFLNSLKSSGGGKYFFVKEGRTRVRLLGLEDPANPESFYAETTNSYGKTKFVVFGEVLGTDQGELSPQFAGKVVPIICPKTVIEYILSLLIEGYTLWGDEGAHGITIHRTGSGLDTNYNVIPSSKPIGFTEGVEMPDQSLAEVAIAFADASEERAKNAGSGGKRGGKDGGMSGEDW